MEKKNISPSFLEKKVLHENIVSYTETVEKYILGITSLFGGTPGLISFFLCFPFFSPCLREYEGGSSGVYRLLASRGKYVCIKIKSSGTDLYFYCQLFFPCGHFKNCPFFVILHWFLNTVLHLMRKQKRKELPGITLFSREWRKRRE